jgi:hypothetical protein
MAWLLSILTIGATKARRARRAGPSWPIERALVNPIAENLVRNSVFTVRGFKRDP